MAIIRTSVFSGVMARMINVDVILPVEDSINSEEKLKTLYLLHGYTDNQEAWMIGTQIALYAKAHNLCVVMPVGENSFYTDQSAAERDYGRFIGEELVQLTRRMFPLSHKREDTFIGGNSMGGYGALRIGMEYRDTFSHIASFSPAILNDFPKADEQQTPGRRTNRRSYYESVFGNLDQLAGSKNDVVALAKSCVQTNEMPSLYLYCGTEDFLFPADLGYHEQLVEMGYPHKWVAIPGAHGWEYWDPQIKDVLDTFLPLDK